LNREPGSPNDPRSLHYPNYEDDRNSPDHRYPNPNDPSYEPYGVKKEKEGMVATSAKMGM
jgi:hypothetical protein